MTVTGELPKPVWHLDPRLTVKGAASLEGVSAVSADEVWTVGGVVHPETGRTTALVGRWNGDFQFVPPAQADPDTDVLLAGVAGVDDVVWAVGKVADPGNGTRTRVERYRRGDVTGPGEVVASPSPDRECALNGVVVVAAAEGWAVGGSGPGGGQAFTRTLVTHWDGVAWAVIPSPNPGTKSNQLNAVAATAADDVWAVGHSRGKETSSLVLHWDGSAWNEIPVPRATAGDDELLLDVAVAGRDSVWVVGATAPVSPGLPSALALHWNGSTWQTFRPQGLTQLSGVSVKSENEVWFAGYAQLPGGPETAHIGLWDGQRLSQVSPGAKKDDNVASALSAVTAETTHMFAVGWRVAVATPTRQPAVFVATG
jgi:hypothetical protein